MELNQTADNLLNALILKAKDQRMKIPYSQEEGFTQSVLAIGQNFDVATLPVTWRNEAEKYHVMRVVSDVAKDALCRAIILISDVRWTQSNEVQDFLGIKPVEEIGHQEWQKQYRRILTAKFDGQLKNLPRRCWHEAIVVVMKGPEFKGKIPMRMARYERGHGDTIHWLPQLKDEEYGAAEFNLLPDWWV
jgi:hypothetical protein